MKKNIKLKTWMTVAAVSICLNGILFYLFAISISISPSTISIGINLITLLGIFFLSFLVSIVYTYFCRISDEEKERKKRKRNGRKNPKYIFENAGDGTNTCVSCCKSTYRGF